MNRIFLVAIFTIFSSVAQAEVLLRCPTPTEDIQNLIVKTDRLPMGAPVFQTLIEITYVNGTKEIYRSEVLTKEEIADYRTGRLDLVLLGIGERTTYNVNSYRDGILLTIDQKLQRRVFLAKEGKILSLFDCK